MSIVKSSTTATTAYIVEANTNGDLVFQTGASPTTAMTLNSSQNVGIGTSSPATKLHVQASTNTTLTVQGDSSGGATFINLSADSNATKAQISGAKEGASGGRLILSYANSSGTVTEGVRLDSSGNLGLGVTPSAWNSGYKVLEFGKIGTSLFAGTSSGNAIISSNAYLNSSDAWTYANNGGAVYFRAANSDRSFSWNISSTGSGTAGNAITFTQAMTLDSGGNLGVGTSSPQTRLHVVGGSTTELRVVSSGDLTSGGASFIRFGGSNSATSGYLGYGGTGNTYDVYNGLNGPITFATNATERARITSGGTLLVGKTNDDDTNAGVRIRADGLVQATRAGADPLSVNRTVNDGTLVSLRQDGVEEGTISVSGNTVSYNAFAGSHWSQLQDGSKPDILRGTVMESINELCVWPGEANERLPKSKVSDTAGSKKVYGVFMAWDNDWTTTNDMYVTAVGAFICRVNGSVTVQEGDLLESNGDGTARVQADDIIRSSTIGKVTSTVKTHEYDDGSYCVPTVLYCG